jgi:hypothetical protein
VNVSGSRVHRHFVSPELIFGLEIPDLSIPTVEQEETAFTETPIVFWLIPDLPLQTTPVLLFAWTHSIVHPVPGKLN